MFALCCDVAVEIPAAGIACLASFGIDKLELISAPYLLHVGIVVCVRATNDASLFCANVQIKVLGTHACF